MFFSVIIPTYNRNELLTKCLELFAPSIQSISENLYEVIVTDDGNSYGARDLIKEKFPWVKWIEGPKRGPAANRNNGAKYSTGEWLVFIDDDCLPECNILEEYKKAVERHPQVSAFEGRIFVDTPQTSFLQESPLNNSGGYFWSCNICIRKDLFNNLAGFDENFPFAAMEDVDFFLRLKKVTRHYMFLPNAAVLHPWRTNKGLSNTIIKRYHSQLYFEYKHPESVKLNASAYITNYLHFTQFTFINAFKFRFKGFRKKLICDGLQLYFAFRCLFKLDKNYTKKKTLTLNKS
jgi:GT2 family glycosyltransferase